MTDDELILYYVQLLIIQYATQPNATATIAALVAGLVANQVISQVLNGFNFTVTPIGQPIDGAAGLQLDAIATYRGSQRVIYGLAPNTFFQFADAMNTSTPSNGFLYAEQPPLEITWLFLTAEQTEQPLYSLSDNDLYRLVQFRAQVQSCDMSIETIDNIIFDFFGDNVAMIDNENMTMFYIDLSSDTDPLFGICAQTQSLPRPAGVLMQSFRADLLTDWFGLQFAETGYDSGFSGFSDAETTLTTGTFLSAP